VLCHPSSVDSLSTSAGTEDHVSMGGWAARKALQVVANVEYGQLHQSMITPCFTLNVTLYIVQLYTLYSYSIFISLFCVLFWFDFISSLFSAFVPTKTSLRPIIFRFIKWASRISSNSEGEKLVKSQTLSFLAVRSSSRSLDRPTPQRHWICRCQPLETGRTAVQSARLWWSDATARAGYAMTTTTS